MHSPKKVYVLTALVLFSTLIVQVWASPNPTLTLQGGGITIDLTYPEEAHPEENIWHNATITANTAVTLNNLTMVIQAPVNSTWQTVFTGKDERNIFMQENSSFQWSMGPLLLPPNVNGTVQCFIFLKTSSVDNISTTIYTTHVSELTFSEMQTLYNEILTNYTALLNEYNDLVGNYSSLLANYTNLFSNNTILQDNYNEQLAIYKSLQDSNNDLTNQFNTLNSNYQSKTADYNSLQTDYQTLNSTSNALQISYNDLQDAYNNLDHAYDELQAQEAAQQSSENGVNNLITIIIILAIIIVALASLTIYIKRKSKEPYIVIHKESPIKSLDEDEEQNETDT